MAASENPELRLLHVRHEITQLHAALAGISFEDFTSSYVLKRAAEHALLMISEAVRALPRDLTDHYPGTDWVGIRGVGNILRHEYFAVDVHILWVTATEHLPRLAPVVDQMIANLRATR